MGEGCFRGDGTKDNYEINDFLFFFFFFFLFCIFCHAWTEVFILFFQKKQWTSVSLPTFFSSLSPHEMKEEIETTHFEHTFAVLGDEPRCRATSSPKQVEVRFTTTCLPWVLSL